MNIPDAVKAAFGYGVPESKWKSTAGLAKEAKQQFLIKEKACPNCGGTKFDEIFSNAAITLRCDCGLTFNLMPELSIADIIRDPAATQSERRQ